MALSSVVAATDGVMARDKGAHPSVPSGRCTVHRVNIHEQARYGRRSELLELGWLHVEIRELLNEYEFPGDDTPIIQGSALKAL